MHEVSIEKSVSISKYSFKHFLMYLHVLLVHIMEQITYSQEENTFLKILNTP